MQKQPVLILLISFVTGIILQELFPASFFILLVFLMIATLSCAVFFFKNLFILKYKVFFYSALAIVAGIALSYFQNQNTRLQSLKKEQILIFKLDKKLKSNEKNRKYEVEAWVTKNNTVADSISFKSIMIIPKTEHELNFKMIYKAKGYVSEIQDPDNDFVFNYKKYLARKEIFHQIYLPNGFLQSPKISISVQDQIKQNRLEIIQKIDNSELSGNSQELVKGIILADRTEMNAETVADFQRTGLVHILAISGTHIAIIFGVFYFILIKIFPAKSRKYAVLFSLIFIWLFAVFIGLGNSVVRACIMLSVYFTYVLLQRKTDFLHSMSLAALVLLLFNVNQLFDVGFQLSFSAVLGIFWFNRSILKWFPKRQNKVITLFKNIFSVTTSAQLGTMPLVLFYFHQYSFLSLFANLLILPVVEILIVGALIISLFIAINLHIPYLFAAFDYFVNFTLKTIHLLSTADILLINNIAMNEVEVGLFFILLFFLKFVFEKLTVKTALRLGYIVVLFIGVRLGYHFYYDQKEEILSHQFNKRKIISVKNDRKIIFYFNEDLDENLIEKFLIDPYLVSRRQNEFSIKKLPKTVGEVFIDGVKYPLK